MRTKRTHCPAFDSTSLRFRERVLGTARSTLGSALGIGLLGSTGLALSCGNSDLVVSAGPDAAVAPQDAGDGQPVGDASSLPDLNSDAGSEPMGAEPEGDAGACAPEGDTDRDGVCDATDLCPAVADDQTDSDGDGIGDACECEEVVCAPPGACREAGVCDPTTGQCVFAPAANGTACDDGDLCSSGDSCQQGECTAGSPVVCQAQDACHTAGVCNSETGECSQPPAADGTSCDDGDLCTSFDSCQQGQCIAGDPVLCTALDQCHTPGVCNPQTGTCSQPVATNGSSCDDGDLCTSFDSCQQGQCTAGDPVLCTALDQCHTPGVCNPQTGVCSQPLATNGTTCNDGDICTSADSCQSGTCTGVEDAECTSSQLVLTWDPVPSANYSHPSRLDPSVPSAFATLGNIEVESWAVEDYGRAGLARYFDSHDHVSSECPGCSNSSASENQHAFETMLQGFVINLVGGGNFDLVSLDYRIRDDSSVNTEGERPHVNTIPGVDTSRVELLLGTTVDIAVPPSSPFDAIDLGPALPEMAQFGTLTFSDVQNVSELYFASTGNVSFDNIVIAPR